MNDSILWYVHDHGLGHLRRAMAVLPHMESPVVVAAGPGIAAEIGRLGVPVALLPKDFDEAPGTTIGPWHHAPTGAAVRARSLAIVAAVEQFGCTSAVVDVSAEVTVLARLLGLHVVSVRQSGRRDDATHRTAFASADVVWIPQHRGLEPVGDELVDDRWQFSGPFSRFDHRTPTRATSPGGVAVLLVGRGGHSLNLEAWAGAHAPAGWRVLVVGTDHPPTGRGGSIEFLGQVDDVGPLLAMADVVITSAGWASVADAASCGARLAVIAEARPFDEQLVRAERLAELGLAVHLDGWPFPADLTSVLDRTMQLRADWAPYHDRSGARRAAAIIERCHRS